MDVKKIALVTGGNRGIRFEICRQLAARNFRVILTARDKTKGLQAVEQLNKGLDIIFHPLQVTDDGSIAALKTFINMELGRLDVIVNNAGILIDSGKTGLNVSADTVRKTFETNTLAPYVIE